VAVPRLPDPNNQLMMQLIPACRELTVDEILALPDVAERVATA